MVEETGEDVLLVFLCPVLKLWRRAKHQAQAHQPQVSPRHDREQEISPQG